jgi:hypothetical protein
MPDGDRTIAARARAVLRSLLGSELALTIAGAGVVLIVLLATIVLPYLDQKRRVVTEVPQPAPLFAVALVELTPGRQGCSDQIGLLPGRQVAEVRVGTFGKPAAPLLFSLSAPGYRETIPVPASYIDNSLVDIPFNGPPRALEGSVCVANQGRVKIALYASEDRTKSRSDTLVNGKPWPSNFDLTFYAAKQQSLLDRANAILERAQLFHAHLGVGLLWILAVLFALGVPLASVAAVALAAGQRDRRARTSAEPT